jgi:hypothetical protein
VLMRFTCTDSMKKTAIVLAVVLLGIGCLIKDAMLTVHHFGRAKTAPRIGGSACKKRHIDFVIKIRSIEA